MLAIFMRRSYPRIVTLICFVISLAFISFFAWHSFKTDGQVYFLLAIFLFLVQLVLLLLFLARQTKVKTSDPEFNLLTMSLQTADTMLSADAQLNILNWNEAAEKMYGYTAAEVIGKKVNMLLKNPMEPEKQTSIIKGLQENNFTGNEYEMKRKNGTSFFILASVSVIRNRNGNVAGYVAIHKDITQRKKGERLLTEFNEVLKKQVDEKTAEYKDMLERFNLIASATNDIIWEADLQKKESWWNDNFYEKFGHPRREEGFTSEAWEQYLHPDDKKRVLDHVNHVINHTKDTSWIDEYRFVKADGTYLNIYDRSYILRDEHGKAYRMIGSMTDLTALFQTRSELEKSEQNLRHVLTSTAEDFYVINKDYRLILINEMAQKNLTLVWGKQVNMGANILDLVPAEKREIIKENFDRVFKGERIEYEISNSINGRQSWVLVRYMPVSNEKGIITGAYVVTKDTTERRRAERALRESEEKYRTLVEQATDGIFIADKTGKFIIVNSSGCKMSQYSEEELMDMTIYDLALTEDIEKNPFRFVEMQRDGGARTERKLKKKDGTVIDIEVNAKFLSGERFLAFIRDITERKKAEVIIQESEAKYRAFFENSMDGILLTSPDGTVLSANPAACIMFGMTENEICALGRRGLVDHSDPAFPGHLEVRQKMGKASGVLTLIHKSGSTFPAEISSARFTDALGQERTSIMIRDITERRKAEEEIAKTNARVIESENYLRTIFNSEPQCIKLLDKDGLLLDMNPAGLLMIEADSLEQVEGKSVINIVDPEYREEFDRLRLNVFKGQSGTLRFSIKGIKGARRWLETHAVPMHDAEGKIVSLLGVTRDITERREAEEKLRLSEERYRSLIEQASDYVMITDDRGQFSDVNSSLCKAFEYERDELLRMNVSALLDPLELGKKPIRFDLLREGQSMLNQRRMMSKNGVMIDVEANVKMLPDGRILAIARDIGERKRAEEQIQREKELSDRIIESLPGLFYLVDETGKYLRWNKLKEIITGYTAEEIGSMRSVDFFEGEEKKIVRTALEEGFKRGYTSVEAHIVTKTGKKILYYFTGIAIEYYGKHCMMGTGIDISDRKKAEVELEASYEAVRKLTNHLQNIREEERAHIAREIHDELGQQLTVLKMDISWLNKKIMAEDDSPIKQKLKDLISMLDGTVKTVRRISSELRPSMLDDLGLVAAIEWQLIEFEKRSGIKTDFLDPQGDIDLPDAVKTGLFRIFQESLTNVARHAGASKVSVVLQQKKGNFVLSIDDDGQGFDKTKIADKRTLGILGMKERTIMIGGTYDIISSPGKGTTVVVAVPLVKQN